MVTRLAVNVSIPLDSYFLSTVYRSSQLDSHVLCIRPTGLRSYTVYVSA